MKANGTAILRTVLGPQIVTIRKIRVKVSGDESATAYIALPGHHGVPKPGIVSKSIRLEDLIKDFNGPRVVLDFNNEGLLIGIEILA